MKNKFFGSKLNSLLLLILIILVLVLFFIYKNKTVKNPIVKETTRENSESVKQDTYTYINHGFSIELPKDYVVPQEFINGRGTYTEIYFPESIMTYITDVVTEESNLSKFEYKGEEKIGETDFKVYFNKNTEGYIYWFKKGLVGYAFSGDKSLLNTFKFLGWPQIEGNKDSLLSFSLQPGQEVSGVMKVTGSLSGGYFSEGSMPVSILDTNRNPTSYGPGFGKATTDWMTSGPVSFEINFDFSKMPKGKAYIKLTQDDPSGGESGIPVKYVLIPIIIK